MTPGPDRVPLLLRLSVLFLPADVRDEILGDLLEHWRGDIGERSRWRRAVWLCRQPVAAAAFSVRSGGRGRGYGIAGSSRGPGRGFGASWLDVKLGLRMALRQPGLTAVAVFALMLGIPVSMIPSQLHRALTATLPFDEGPRIVGVQNRDLEASRPDERSLHDFELWRQELGTFQRLGAFRSSLYNVISDDGRAAPVRGAEVTASTFDILRVQPLLGRRLVPADEGRDAPDVVVLGHDTWQSRLGGDPDVVGRMIHIGRTPHEVVGVMPAGFLFPANDHLWLPLRARSIDYPPGAGPEIRVFGRLIDGVTLAEADAEARGVGQRLAAAQPATHGHLRSEVVPFVLLGFNDLTDVPAFLVLNVLALLLLVVACGNVGILILARTATRASEIAVRTALGAGRRRIVSQIFVEALLLAVVAAGLGLALGDILVTRFQASLGADNAFPFWLDLGVQPETVARALGLAILSAVIAGVVPALKATGRDVRRGLQQASAGVSGVRFGGLASALIVAEVAISVWFLTIGGTFAPQLLAPRDHGMGIDRQEYLVSGLRMPRIEPPPDRARAYEADFRRHLADTQLELLRRLQEEPSVGGVAFGDRLPGEDHPGTWVEVEGQREGDGPALQWARTARVDLDFFEALEQPILAGRSFDREDVAPPPDERRTIIVNQTLVEQALGGRNAVGRRLRRVSRGGGDPGPWLEIVGVVGHLGMNEVAPDRDAGFYVPVAPGDVHPLRAAIRTSDPIAFTARLREIASEVEPTAMIANPVPLAEHVSEDRKVSRWGALVFGLIASVALVLSTAGLYALVSFTVSERTREIGVRVALGALPRSIAATVGRRALFQLAGGVLLGLLASLVLLPRLYDGPDRLHVDWPLLAGVVASLTLLIGLLSCVRPTLRGLEISPMDVLKEG